MPFRGSILTTRSFHVESLTRNCRYTWIVRRLFVSYMCIGGCSPVKLLVFIRFFKFRFVQQFEFCEPLESFNLVLLIFSEHIVMLNSPKPNTRAQLCILPAVDFEIQSGARGAIRRTSRRHPLSCHLKKMWYIKLRRHLALATVSSGEPASF